MRSRPGFPIFSHLRTLTAQIVLYVSPRYQVKFPVQSVLPIMKKEVLLAAVILISAAFATSNAQAPLAAHDGVAGDRSGDADAAKRRKSLAALVDSKGMVDEEKARQSLADEDWFIRGEAALALARAKRATAGDLVPLLQDKSWFVRGAALEALRLLKDPSVGPNVLPLLDPADPYLCARAAALLGEIKYAPATDSLSKLLSGEDDQVKREAAFALGLLKDEAVVDPLIGLLKDPSLSVRAGAATALGQIGDNKAQPAVLAELDAAVHAERPDAWLYAAALYRLGGHDRIDLVIAGLKSEFADIRAGALNALIEFHDPVSIPALCEAAKPDSTTPPTSSEPRDFVAEQSFRLHLAAGLAEFDDERARAALMSMFGDPDPMVRAAAVTGLAASAHRAAQSAGTALQLDATLSALVELLKTEQSPMVVSAVCESLPLLDREKAINALLASMSAGDNITKALAGLGITPESVSAKLSSGELPDRIRAAELLGRLGDHRAVLPLAGVLEKGAEPALKIKAAESLGLLADRRAEDALVQASRADDPLVKTAAIAALGRLGDASISDALFEAARDGHENVRDAALKSLGVLGVSVEKLTADATSPSWQVRVTAIATLGRLGDPRGVPVVIGGLSDKDDKVRMESARTLAIMGDPRAIEPLIGALKDANPDVRFESAAALGAYRDGRSLAPLTALLSDKDARVSAAAAETLARMRDPRATRLLVGYLASPDWQLRARAAQVLMRVPDAAASGGIVPLVNALRDRDLVVRYYASEALVAVGAPAVPELANLFSTGRFIDRERSARILARIGRPSVGPLARLIEDKGSSPELKAAAAHVLGFIADPGAIPSLLGLLSDQRYFVREQASFALGRIGGPAIEKLTDLTRSSTPAIRESALEGLGAACSEVGRKSGVPADPGEKRAEPPEVIRSVDLIINALRDPNVSVRSAAVHALGESGSPRAVEPLIAILKDETSTLRGEASVALGKLRSAAVPGLVLALSSDRPSIRMLAAQALGETGSIDAVPALIQLISTDVSGARGEGIDALGKLGDASAADAIIAAMAAGSPGVRQKSISALVLLHSPKAEDALISALSDKSEDVRHAAAAGLGDIGDDRATASLEKLADNDPSSDVRSAAASAIERLLARNRGADK
jgi:HEAT repeat protein